MSRYTVASGLEWSYPHIVTAAHWTGISVWLYEHYRDLVVREFHARCGRDDIRWDVESGELTAEQPVDADEMARLREEVLADVAPRVVAFPHRLTADHYRASYLRQRGAEGGVSSLVMERFLDRVEESFHRTYADRGRNDIWFDPSSRVMVSHSPLDPAEVDSILNAVIEQAIAEYGDAAHAEAVAASRTASHRIEAACYTARYLADIYRGMHGIGDDEMENVLRLARRAFRELSAEHGRADLYWNTDTGEIVGEEPIDQFLVSELVTMALQRGEQPAREAMLIRW